MSSGTAFNRYPHWRRLSVLIQKHANDSRDSAGTTFDARLIGAYRWLIVP